MQLEYIIEYKYEYSYCFINFINMFVIVNIIGNYFKYIMYMLLYNVMLVKKR